MSERRERYKDFFAELEARGMLDYGSNIPTSLVHELLGIELPELGTKAEFDRASLDELSAIDYVRGQLLKTGRYIAGVPAGYRVLSPHENQKQISIYMDAAQRKMVRAKILNDNTPMQHRAPSAQVEARIELARSGMRSRFRVGDDSPSSPLN